MKFAHFSHVWGKARMTAAERYAQLWREIQLCDELGFDYGFCVEHHFRPDESWMSAPTLYTIAAGARTKRMRLGAMGHVVPLHQSLRLAEEIAVADNMLDGRLEVGLVSGIMPGNFGPFGASFETRRASMLEFVSFLKAAYASETFTFDGQFHKAKDIAMAVRPRQNPHPPLWIETRDRETLAFCAAHGINTGYFFSFPRSEAAVRYREFLELWHGAGRKDKPNIAYSCICYVAPTDAEAHKRLEEAGTAYRSLLPPAANDAELAAHIADHARRSEVRGEHGQAEIARHIIDWKWQHENDLILVGSPDTVTRKLQRMANEGVFNTYFAEFNFGNLPEDELMRSIRLFGTEVLPQLRDFEPFKKL